MKPLVSICCITYNHEKYVSEALDSLLMQDTTFPYEIIVHDDASTDRTTEIIRKYERKYPHKIRTIYQTENQYSKGKKVTFECVLPNIKGDYIAFCEGDDYWSDKKKLQKQIDFLIKHKDYSACFHGVKVVNTERIPTGAFRGPVFHGTRDYSMKDTIQGGFIHVSSLVMKAKAINNGIPQWALKSRHGDYALALIATADGKVHFIDDIMSVYRIGVENSVMTVLRSSSTKAKEIKYHEQRIKTLEEANDFYNYKFDEDISLVIHHSEIRKLILEDNIKELFNHKYRRYFREKGVSDILKLIIKVKAPKMAILIRKMKKR